MLAEETKQWRSTSVVDSTNGWMSLIDHSHPSDGASLGDRCFRKTPSWSGSPGCGKRGRSPDPSDSVLPAFRSLGLRCRGKDVAACATQIPCGSHFPYWHRIAGLGLDQPGRYLYEWTYGIIADKPAACGNAARMLRLGGRLMVRHPEGWAFVDQLRATSDLFIESPPTKEKFEVRLEP